MPLCFAAADGASLPLYLLGEGTPEAAFAALPSVARLWASAQGFTGALGQCCVLPGPSGAPSGALFGIGTPDGRARGRFHLARAAESLPDGAWHIVGDLTRSETEEAALGWLLAGYRFERYKSASAPTARLKCPDGLDAARLEAIANAEALTRDLINTPASDMGPEELEQAVFALASRHGATASAIRGDDLLTQGFPMIHAVGRASPRAPRLLDLRWGTAGPELTLVGKGVCFDTGGLDLKPASGMGLMKKDMGGAATVIGLAQMIMALGLPLRLRVLIPAVENAVSGNAFRPQDILTSRKGLSVEVNNTDAEGRLVLADALACADEESPDLILCMATLTGAARVALGPDLPPFYTDDAALAEALTQGATDGRRPALADAVRGPRTSR